jgi:phage-related protein
LPSIADIYVTLLPETSQIADGITRSLREVDPKVAEASRRWGREIQEGIAGVQVDVKAETAKAKAEIDAAAHDRHSTIHVNVDRDRLGGEISSGLERVGESAAMSAATGLGTAISSSMATSAMQGFSVLGQQGGQALSGAMSQGFGDAAGAIGSVAGPEGTVIGEILGNSIMSSLKPILMTGAVAALAGVASSLSGLAGLAPAGLAGAGSIVATLAIGLDGVKDAWEAAGKAADASGKDQEAKTKAVASAQKSLRDAVSDEATAQRDVANARKDARQQLEDLNVQLRGGVIDEKQAILDAQAARRDLATGRFKDSIEYQQAQLRVEAADQRVLEAHERNVALQGKAAEANSKGVEQSDQVVAAQQRLAKAHENVGLAQQGLAEAQGKTSSAADTAAQAMAKLSPAAQQFVGTLIAMKPQWESFKNSVQDALFANLGPQIQQLATAYLPMLQGAFTTMASLINQAASAFMGFLQQPTTMALMQTLLNNLTGSFQAFLPTIQTLGQAFLQMTVTGSAFLPQLGQIIGQFATAFAKFASSPALGTWLQTGLTALGQLTNMLPTVLQMFMDLAPIGTATLGGIGQILTALAPAIAPLSTMFAAFITAATPILTLFTQIATTVITALAPSMTALLQAFTPVADAILSAVTPALQTMGAALFQTGLELAGALIPAMQQLLPFIGPLVQAFANWMVVLEPLLPSLMQLAVSQMPAWIQALQIVLPLMTRMLELFTGLVGQYVPQAAAVISDFATTVSQAWETIGRVIETAWNKIKPILEDFKNTLHALGLDRVLTALQSILPSLPTSTTTTPLVPVPKTGDIPVTAPAVPGAPATGGLPGVPTAPVDLPPSAAPALPSSVPGLPGALPGLPSATATLPGDTPLAAALRAKGFSPKLIRLIQGFSQVEGLNAAGQPTLGFTDAQLGGRSDLQAHVDALAKQFMDRASVAGPFPEGGTDEQQAQWIANVVGQSGLRSDWQGNAQPKDYVQQVMTAMGGSGPASPGAALPGAALPGIPGASALPAPRSGALKEGGLQPNALAGGRLIEQLFPQIADIGGVRQDSLPDHPSGHALDIMIPDWQSAQGKALGAQIDQYLRTNAKALGVKYTIWDMQYNPTGGQSAPYEYKGDDPNQQHKTHVHVTFTDDPTNLAAAGLPSAGLPTVAAPYGVSPNGMPLGTQNTPMYVTPAGPSGQQLGQDIFSGFLEIFGIGSLFKNPLEGGLFKGFKGLMSALTGGGKGGSGGGLPASAYASGADAGIPSGGGGDILSGLGNMLPGIVPQPYGPVTPAPDENGPPVPGGPGPGAAPSGYSIAKTPAAQGNVDQSINFYGPVGNPASINQAAMDLNVPRARQNLTGLPVPA